MTETKYFLETFGCQMNILDSQLVEGQLRARGMTPTGDYRRADIILFNTCSVRQHAEDKVLSRLGQLRRFKQRRPETIIGVIGCMAEREKEGLFIRAPHLDLLCGPGELNRLPALIDEVRRRHERVAALAGSLSRRTEVLQRALEYDSLEALDLSRAPQLEGNILQSYIRVQRGCDQFCTFCVVPFTRGPERSRPPGHIVQEARMLAERGCREITLLGQTVNSYVHQEDGRPVRFARLLERVHDVPGIDRIRFVTSFPADWDEDIFRVMRDCPRIMPYLHLPAQSGSDAILRAMRRGYTVTQYRRIIDSARHYLPHIAVAGDIIVGFCGETPADFRRTVQLVRDIGYAALYVFKYSPRPGTKADRALTDDVPEEVKAARCTELLAIQAEIAAQHKHTLLGRSVEVLVEGLSRFSRKTLLGQANAQLRSRGKTSAAMTAAHGLDPRRSRSGQTAAAGRAPLVIQESEQDRGREVLPARAGGMPGSAAVRPPSYRPQSSDQALRAAGVAGTLPARAPVSGAAVQLVGRTPQDMIVVFDAPSELIGAIVEVQVDAATANTLFGQVVRVVSPARPPAAPQGSGDSIAPHASPSETSAPRAGRSLPVLAC